MVFNHLRCSVFYSHFPCTHFPVMILRKATDGVGVLGGGVNQCLVTCLINVDLKEGILLSFCPSVLPITNRFINKWTSEQLHPDWTSGRKSWIFIYNVNRRALTLYLFVMNLGFWKGSEVLRFLCPDLKHCLTNRWKVQLSPSNSLIYFICCIQLAYWHHTK